MDRAEEQRLIQRVVAGDRRAAGDLVRSFQGPLYAYLIRLSGRPDVAEDIVQETFIRVLTNLGRFDPTYRFSTWLFTIARNLYLNQVQKLKPASDSPRLDNSEASEGGPSETAASHDDAGCVRSLLDRALLQLSAEQREIVILFHQMEWPIALIASHMSLPEGTVKSHLHRGRRRLREAVEHLRACEQLPAASHARAAEQNQVAIRLTRGSIAAEGVGL